MIGLLSCRVEVSPCRIHLLSCEVEIILFLKVQNLVKLWLQQYYILLLQLLSSKKVHLLLSSQELQIILSHLYDKQHCRKLQDRLLALG